MFDFPELDATTREYMLSEFRAEQDRSDLPPYRPKGYIGSEPIFVSLMERAITDGDEISLLFDLSVPEWWDEYSIRSGKRRPVEYTDRFDVQAKRFAITEFNTWYVRGLCRRLIDEGIDACELFRAERAYQPRAECRNLEGIRLITREVYAGHRIRYHHHHADRAALMVPLGPNCHHSVRRLA